MLAAGLRALSLGAAVALAGCASSPAALTPLRLVELADSVCEQHYVATPYTLHKPESERELERSARAHAAVEETALAKLVKLRAPASMQPRWGRFIDDRRVLIADWLKVAQHGLRDGDAKILTAIYDAQESMLLAARLDGFRECQEFG